MPKSVDTVPAKNPLKVRAGQLSAARRWGTQATVRIDDLQPTVRAAVLALIRANEAAKKAAPNANGTASKESRRASVADHPAAA